MTIDIARKDTICALSSAQGPGAIAVVRASGNYTREIFKKIFVSKAKFEFNFLRHGQILNLNNICVDDVMAVFFAQDKSFTGENSFEIYCHGNSLIIKEILDLICNLGARLAEPGEFSLRAVLNNKINLVQAESILDLIHAETSKAKNMALKGVQGGLYKKIFPLHKKLIHILAELEARMDFPDEDLGNLDKFKLIQDLEFIICEIKKLLVGSNYALRLHEGARVVLCGAPNAGKSTLFNNLVGDERAIVHKQAGTTRDVIEAKINLAGLAVQIVDIAGLREFGKVCEIEQMGIKRAQEELKKAHVIIWLADGTKNNYFQDEFILRALENFSGEILKVINKVDCLKNNINIGDLHISAKTGLGINKLKQKLEQILCEDSVGISEIYITRARQKSELEDSLASLKHALSGLNNNLADEVITSELRSAGLSFDRLFGTNISEDILDKIFSEFCIGK